MLDFIWRYRAARHYQKLTGVERAEAIELSLELRQNPLFGSMSPLDAVEFEISERWDLSDRKPKSDNSEDLKYEQNGDTVTIYFD